MSMKVVISGYVGKKITGIGRNLISLLDNSTSDIKYVLYANEDMVDDFKLKNPNVQIKTYGVSKNSSMKNLLWTTFVFPLKVVQEKADCGLIPNFTLLIFKYRPTVVIMHDLIEFNVPDKFSKIKMLYRTRLADPITAKRADKIITVSKNSKRDIVKFLNIKEDKISVVYNGVDQNKFHRMNAEKAKSIIKGNDWPMDFILYAGTIDHPGKNAMGVIKAFEKLKDDKAYTGYLILAGMPGANHEAIDDYVAHSRYKEDIVMTGFVTDEELVALYSTCKVFVFVSLYEGFGIPPLEALACGAKVVTSNTSSLPEVVGNVGRKVDPTSIIEICDAIKACLNNDEFPSKDAIREHLKQFDWRELSKKFETVLIDS